MICAFIMKYLKIRYLQAFKILQQKRPQIRINKFYQGHLKNFEEELRNRKNGLVTSSSRTTNTEDMSKNELNDRITKNQKKAITDAHKYADGAYNVFSFKQVNGGGY